MTYNLLKLTSTLILVVIPMTSSGQDTRPSSGLHSSSVFLNYSNSIFNTPIEQYKYIKTQRGIEIYETYRHPTNGNINQTIFPKTMPVAVIKTNSVTKNEVIYKTYSNSIYNKPIEFTTIRPAFTEKKSSGYTKKKYLENLPSYDGGKEINYGGESEW